MIGGEYKVRTITGNEFDVIYTRSSATVKGCLSRFRRMFKNSDDEWVAGLDVEYTTVLGQEKYLKDEERKKPTVIQVCLHDLCLVYHICHADVECLDFKDFLESKPSQIHYCRLYEQQRSPGSDRPHCRQPLRPPEESAGVLSSAFNADPGRSHGSSFVG